MRRGGVGDREGVGECGGVGERGGVGDRDWDCELVGSGGMDTSDCVCEHPTLLLQEDAVFRPFPPLPLPLPLDVGMLTSMALLNNMMYTHIIMYKFVRSILRLRF